MHFLVSSCNSKCDHIVCLIGKYGYRSNLLGGLMDSLRLYLLPGVLAVSSVSSGIKSISGQLSG